MKNTTKKINAKLINADLLESLDLIVTWLDANEHWLKIQGYGSQVLDIRIMEYARQSIKKSTE